MSRISNVMPRMRTAVPRMRTAMPRKHMAVPRMRMAVPRTPNCTHLALSVPVDLQLSLGVVGGEGLLLPVLLFSFPSYRCP